MALLNDITEAVWSAFQEPTEEWQDWWAWHPVVLSQNLYNNVGGVPIIDQRPQRALFRWVERKRMGEHVIYRESR